MWLQREIKQVNKCRPDESPPGGHHSPIPPEIPPKSRDRTPPPTPHLARCAALLSWSIHLHYSCGCTEREEKNGGRRRLMLRLLLILHEVFAKAGRRGMGG